MNDVIPKAVSELIDLFATELHGVKFPECDEAALSLLSSDVLRAAADLEAAEARCADARRALSSAEESLLVRTARAHAYARIFADGDPVLLARIESIAIPRGMRKAAPVLATDGSAAKRRPKPLKSEPLLGVIEIPSSEAGVS